MAKKRKSRRTRSRIVVPARREVAAVPGTITPPEDAPPPRISILSYGPDSLREQARDDATQLAALREEGSVLWIDVVGVGNAETFKELARQFDLHALAMEDVVNLHQRPKVEEYEDHTYAVVKMPTSGGDRTLEQVSLLLGKGFLITVQERPGDCFEPVRQRIRKSRGRIRHLGADYLAYAVIDAIIDNYFPRVEALNTRLEALEEHVLRSPDDEAVMEIHATRHELHGMRRVLAPTREALGLLSREEMGFVADSTRVFLRDCQDHVAQLLDSVEACRELSASLMELHQSAINQRMNEVMKVLTLIATIFIPLSFFAGLYGMNFDRASPWNMPELGHRFGYPLLLLFMLILVIGMLTFFRRRGWIGSAHRPPEPGRDEARQQGEGG